MSTVPANLENVAGMIIPGAKRIERLCLLMTLKKASFIAPVCRPDSQGAVMQAGDSGAGRLIRLQKRSAAARPIVGVTSQIIRSSKWYKKVSGLGVDAIEINRRDSKLYLNAYFLEKIKRYLQGIRVSLHSATTGVFQDVESFTRAELAMLQAEIDVARFLDAREVVFHLNERALACDEHIERLAGIIHYAKEMDIDPIYESDALLQADHTCNVLETFADVGYALDLGHLNNGYCRKSLGCEIEEFVSKVRDRIVYLHASNNCGAMDEHKGLNDGTLEWRGVLDLLDMSRVRKIIIEVRSIEYLKDTQDALREYLSSRSSRHERTAD